ncbi:hypothetical protein AAP_02419 [Ascosphaera apis ARSEF 7405]|uniref:Iron-sulfur cluster assembly factor IBA57 homolog, mitochondrial n=1 Tax=Ascosphaera apis ARSEF 7405 TaxID=392613 RepID=A0A168A940_9EURO|nr:hypothetical protein AAP_02419 [Ascosphaera apis ARSEF 7405]
MSIRLQRAWQCARTIRQFSTSQRLFRLPVDNDIPPPPPPPDTGYVKLQNRVLLELSGEDATNFLQGLVMQDVIPTTSESRNPQRMYYTAMLNTRGRIQWDLFIYRFIKSSLGPDKQPMQEIAYYLEADRLELPALKTQISKRRLSSKIRWKEIKSQNLAVYAAWNKPTSEVWKAQTWTPPRKNFEVDEFGLGMTFVDPRGPHFGYRIVGVPSQVEEVMGKQALPLHYQIRRYECGIPEGAMEVFHDGSMPMETNFDATGGVSFTKGCYVGQELTHRTYHSGVIRKRILPVLLQEETDSTPYTNDRPIYDPTKPLVMPTTGSKLHIANTLAGRKAGQFIRSVGNVGLGLCYLTTMTDINLVGVENKYDPNRYVIAHDSQAVATTKKITAFVPPWLRNYIEAEEAAKINPLQGNVRRIGSGRVEDGPRDSL